MEPSSFFQDAGPARFPLQDPETYFSAPQLRALVVAAAKGDAAEVRRAVAMGAAPNDEGVTKAGSHYGFTPLHYVIAANRPAGVRALVAAGADPEHRARNMGSPLLFTIILNNPELLALLLELKPVPQLAPSTQQQLLFESARRGSPRSLALLVERGVPVDIRDAAGYTLLLRSLDMGLYDLSLWLLQHGASVSITPDGGPSPARSVAAEMASVPADSPKQRQLQEIRRFMEAKGVVFP